MSRWRFTFYAIICLTVSIARAGTLVQFRTTLGDIEVELYDQDKPITVQNFLNYVQNGLYTDMFMHRVVTNFVIQGGAIFVAYRNTPSNTLAYIPTFPPITNEFKVGKFYSNTYGTIAMAKTSDPNSATSQFFFNLANNSAALDNTNNSGGFTVFGHVISGTNNLNKFKVGPTNTLVKEVNAGGILSELPVIYTAVVTNIQYSDLIYVDVSLLQVAIKPVTGGAREVSWNSVTGLTNVVEFSTNMPPTWFTLIRTNGTGNRFAINDSATGPLRFYRVRVEY